MVDLARMLYNGHGSLPLLHDMALVLNMKITELLPNLRFPVIALQRKHQPAVKAGSIPWHVAERAYAVYVQRYGRSQTLQRLAERGGLYAEEMDDLLPDWKDMTGDTSCVKSYVINNELDNLRAASMRELQMLQGDGLHYPSAIDKDMTTTPHTPTKKA